MDIWKGIAKFPEVPMQLLSREFRHIATWAAPRILARFSVQHHVIAVIVFASISAAKSKGYSPHPTQVLMLGCTSA